MAGWASNDSSDNGPVLLKSLNPLSFVFIISSHVVTDHLGLIVRLANIKQLRGGGDVNTCTRMSVCNY